MNVSMASVSCLRPQVKEEYLDNIEFSDIPIIIDSNSNIIDGHKRFYCAKNSGKSEINVFELDFVDNIKGEYVKQNKKYRQLHLIEEAIFIKQIVDLNDKVAGLLPRDYDVLDNFFKLSVDYIKKVYQLKIDRKSLLNLIFLPLNTIEYLLDLQTKLQFSGNEFRTLTQYASVVDLRLIREIESNDKKSFFNEYLHLVLPVTTHKNELLKKVNGVLPKKTRILNKNNFELNEYELILNFSDIDDLKNKLQNLNDNLSNKKLNELFSELNR